MPGIFAEAWRAGAESLPPLWAEITGIRLRGDRARAATMTALSVVLATAIACAMALPDVWWAAISGFIACQATAPASLRRGVLRIAGTAAGAALAFFTAGWLAYDHVACCFALLVGGFIATLGLTVSRHGYAWLLCGITFGLVLMMSLADPGQVFFVATTRTIEVVVGTGTAILVATMLGTEAVVTHEPPAPGWHGLLDARWPAVLHAARAGIAVSTLPLVWSLFDLPDVTSMATTMASVMAIPVLADAPLDDERRIITRAVQRILGCVIGGSLGLLLVGLQLQDFAPWLAALFVSVWVFAWMQGSARGMSYVGVQAGMVLVMTLVQGEGPPASIMPGINRLTGITLGLTVLGVVSVLLQPAPKRAAA
jgi:uncharacterized membrane protein YccC